MSLAFLIQMGWKSALIAGAALAVLRLLRSRPAADRSAVLALTVAILLALPLAAVVAPSLKVTSPLPAPAAAQPAPATAMRRVTLSAAPAEGLVRASAAPAPRPGATHISLNAFLKAAYVGGALLLLARMAMGLITLARWSREAHEAAEPE